VRHRYCLSFAWGDEPQVMPAIGLRFLDFEEDVPAERLLDARDAAALSDRASAFILRAHPETG